MTTKTTKTTQASSEKAGSKTPVPKVQLPVVLSKCQCGTGFSGSYEEDGTPIYEACEATTKSEFAPGHDARLKSQLLRLHRAGLGYRLGETTTTPVQLLLERGWIKDASEADARVRKPKAKKEATAEAA